LTILACITTTTTITKQVKLRSNVIRVITEARERNLPTLEDNGLVRSLLQTYETLGFEKRDRSHLFQRELEDHLVADAQRYFARRGSALLCVLPVSQYLVEVETFLAVSDAPVHYAYIL
jgi:Cullin family